MKNPHKALGAIEILVGGDLGMDLECFLHGMHSIKPKDRLKYLKRCAKVIGQIYCISHAENTRGCNHSTWEEIKYKIIKESKN